LRPSFEWENPQKAMKGNLNNVLFSMIATIFLIGCMFGMTLFLKRFYVSEVIISLIVEILLILLNIVAI